VEVPYPDEKHRAGWLSLSAYPLKDETGEATGVIEHFRDITRRKQEEARIAELGRLKEDLISSGNLEEKLSHITESVVRIFEADSARIWIVGPGDRCDSGCPHACRQRERCLQLIARSGRHSAADEETYCRVPFNGCRTSRAAAAEESGFLVNDVAKDLGIADPAWAKEAGLVSCAGYRILSAKKEPIGVFALFSKRPITAQQNSLLESVTATAGQVIQVSRAAEALRQSEEGFRALVESTNDWIWEVDRNGIHTYVSPQVETVLGYTPDEVIGKAPFDFMLPEEAERTARDFKRLAAERKPFSTLENVGLHRDGRQVILEASGVPVRDAQGNFAGYRGVVRDITERRRIEESLRRSEESSRTLVESVQAAIVVHGSDGRIILANQMAKKLLGPFTTETDGRKVSELEWRMVREDGSRIPPEEYPVTRVLRTGKAVTDFFVGAHRLGENEIHWALLNAIPVFDEDGHLIKVVVSFVGMSSRRQIEEELRRYEHMVSGASDWIALMDRNLRYLVVNEAYAGAVGMTPDELVGQTPAEIFGEELFHAVIEPNARRALRGEKVRYQTWVDIPARGPRYLDAVYSPRLDAQGKVLGYAVFARDDTERKKMEEELRRYERMVSGAGDMMALLDAEYCFLAANEACLKAFGKQRNELLGHTAAEVFGEEFFHTVVKPHAEQCLRGEEVRDQRWVDLPGPGRRHVDAAYFPYLDAHHEKQEFAFFGRDDTEREEMREAWRENEERYRAVLDTVTDAVLIGGLDGEILFVNEGFCRTFGYTREEAAGMHARDLVRTDCHPIFDGFVRQIAETGRFSGETVNVRKDGTELSMEGRGAGIRFGGRDCVLTVIRDVTERKEAQRALEGRARELAQMHGRLEVRNAELQKALDEIATLRGILPICSYCKKVRNDEGYWQQVDTYISAHTGALVSHGICPGCLKEHYPDLMGFEDDSSSSTDHLK